MNDGQPVSVTYYDGVYSEITPIYAHDYSDFDIDDIGFLKLMGYFRELPNIEYVNRFKNS